MHFTEFSSRLESYGNCNAIAGPARNDDCDRNIGCHAHIGGDSHVDLIEAYEARRPSAEVSLFLSPVYDRRDGSDSTVSGGGRSRGKAGSQLTKAGSEKGDHLVRSSRI